MLKGTVYFIIVAAGGGTRFGGDIPKQFLKLGGKPVVCHSIDLFRSVAASSGIKSDIVLVLSENHHDLWRKLCAEAGYTSPLIVTGGATRAQSVEAAIAAVNPTEQDIVLVHDGARPLAGEPLVRRIIDTCISGTPAVVPALKPTDSLMELSNDDSAAPVDRARYLAVQTPQGFNGKLLADAYRTCRADIARMTDDASVAYAAGCRVQYVEGNPYNLKITNPADLEIAEVLLRRCSHSEITT